jgi:hypothetical protein
VSIGKRESTEARDRAENERNENREKNRQLTRRFNRATRFHTGYMTSVRARDYRTLGLF